MKRHLGLAVFIIVAAGLFALAHWSMREKEARDKVEQDEKKVVVLEADKVGGVTLANAKGTFKAVRRGGEWYLVEPIEDRASDFALNNILDNLKGLEIAKRFSAEGKTLAHYGLEPPGATVTYWLEGKETEPVVVKVGEKNPKNDQLYLLRGEGKEILLVGTVLDTLRTKTLDEVRDKKLLRTKLEDLTAVKVVNANGTFVLRREPAVSMDVSGDASADLAAAERPWMVVEPLATPLDHAFPDRVLTTLLNAEAKAIPAETPDEVQRFGLEVPAVTVELTTKDGQALSFRLGTVQEGQEIRWYFHRADQRRVAQIEASLADKFGFGKEEVVEKRLVRFDEQKVEDFRIDLPDGQALRFRKEKGSWVYQADKELLVDRTAVEKILRDLRNLERGTLLAEKIEDPGAVGLLPPVFRFSLLEGNRELGGFSIGAELLRDGLPCRYATNQATGFLFTISKVDFDDLPDDLTAFRTKTVSTLDKYDLTSLRFVKGGQEYRLEKSEGAAWTLTHGPVTVKEPKKVYEMLDTLGQLLIEEFVVPNSALASETGFDTPVATLTLADRNGNTQQVEFGKEAGVNLRWAKRTIEKAWLKVKAVPLENLETLFQEMERTPPAEEKAGQGEAGSGDTEPAMPTEEDDLP